MLPTIAHARRFLELLDHGLVTGLGNPRPGEMCIEALWCYVLGLPHGDDPGCVGAEVRKFKIGLNDKPWTSPQARAKGLRALGLAQIGSDQINQRQFRDLLWFRCGTEIQPWIWRFLATRGNKDCRLALATRMEISGSLAECRAHARAHGYDYDYDYDYAHGYDYALGYVCAYGNGYAHGYGYGYDTWFSRVAAVAVDVLKELKSPGCEWLYLLDEHQPTVTGEHSEH